MSKKQKIEDYINKYGNIPKDLSERFMYLWERLNIRSKDIPKIQDTIRSILSIQTESISFVFYFVPEATPRPRYSRFTNAFYVKNANDYKSIFEDFINSCEASGIGEITTPCEFICKTYKPTPSVMTRYEKICAELELIKDISKPDWDNLGKTYSDMVQHGLLMDDSIIYKSVVEKLYSAKPRIEITINYKLMHDSTYNKRKIDNVLKRRNLKRKE